MNFLEARACGECWDVQPATAVVLGVVATGCDVNGRTPSLEEDRAGLVERLRTRQPEIEAAVFALVERLVASIADEYERELEGEGRSPERRRAERVRGCSTACRSMSESSAMSSMPGTSA